MYTSERAHDTRRDTVLQSSAATLPKSSAATAVRPEIASQSGAFSFKPAAGARAVDASWRATTTRALPAALEMRGPRGEQQMPLQLFFTRPLGLAAARRVRIAAGSTLVPAPWSGSSRNIELLTAKSFFHRIFTVDPAQLVRGSLPRSGLMASPVRERRVPSRPRSYVHINAQTL